MKKNDIKTIYKLEHPEDIPEIVKIINELGYDVSLQEAEEIWGWFSGSVEAQWLSTSYYDETTKNMFKEIIEKYIEEKGNNNIESSKSQFAKTKDGWVVRVLNKNEDCIECGNWTVKYVDGKNIGKVADINQNELTLIEGTDKEKSDHIVILLFGENKTLLSSNSAKVEEKLKSFDIKYNVIEQGMGSIVAECLSNKSQNEIYDILNEVLHNDIGLEVMDYDKYNKEINSSEEKFNVYYFSKKNKDEEESNKILEDMKSIKGYLGGRTLKTQKKEWYVEVFFDKNTKNLPQNVKPIFLNESMLSYYNINIPIKIPKKLEGLSEYSKKFKDAEEFVNAVWKHLNINPKTNEQYTINDHPQNDYLPQAQMKLQDFEYWAQDVSLGSGGWFSTMGKFWEVVNGGKNIKSSDWEDEESKFNIGDIVKISEDEFYGGKIGEVADKDIERDMYNPGGNEWMNIYKIEGEGIDTDSAESWVSEYNLEKVEEDKIESAEKNDIDDLREQAKYILINNPIKENEIEMYKGLGKRESHGISKDIWQQVWKENEDKINILKYNPPIPDPMDKTKKMQQRPDFMSYTEYKKLKNINSTDENLKLRRKLDDLKEDRFHLEKKLNKSLGEKDKEQTKGLLRRMEDIHDEIKKIEDKNKENINSADKGYVIKNQNNDNEYFTVDMNGKGKWTKSAEQASVYDTIEEVNKVIGRLDELNDNNMKGYWEKYKMESKNIKSAEEGEGTMKNVSDIIPLIEKMEVDYYISLDGSAHEVSLQDVNEMTNDHYIRLDDKKFIEKWNGKGYSFHPHGDYEIYNQTDNEEDNDYKYDELWFGLSYYIYTKDGGLITIDYHDWREDPNGVEEIRDSSAQANEIFEVIQSQNTWDIDIDTLAEKVNNKDGIKSATKYPIKKGQKGYSVDDVRKAGFTLEPMVCKHCGSTEVVYNQYGDFASCQECGKDQDEPVVKKNKEGKVKSAEDFETIKNKILDELTALTYEARDNVGEDLEKSLFDSIKNCKTVEEIKETFKRYEEEYPMDLLGLTDNMNKIINSSKKGIKAEEGNPTGYETYNDGALIKYDEAKILEDFKNEHKRSYDVFNDIRRGEESPISSLEDIIKGGVSSIDNYLDTNNVSDATYDIAIQTMEEFYRDNDINEGHLSDDVKDDMRYHIEGLANYNVEDLFNYPVLLKKVMAEIYTETGVVVGYDNIKWTPEANKWKKEALKYIDEQGIRDICNNATYGGMAFIGGIVSGSEIIKKMYDGEKIINVDTAIIGIHDSANGSGYYVEGNGNPVMDIKESKLDIGSYSLGAVFGTGEWVYASKKNNVIKADKSNVQSMVSGYLETMLWSSNDESTPSGGEPMDINYSIIDISDETKEEANKDCIEFAKQAGDLLKDKMSAEDWWDVGHNFWLTRNGHGAGFWDSNNYEKEVGEKLTEICKKFGEKSPYVGDDGKIYANKKNIKDGPHKDGTLDISENVPEENEPQEDDMYLSDSGPLGSKTSVSVNQNFLGEYNSEEEAVKAIKEWINKNKFYPNIWYVSDHGNIIPYSIVTSSNIKGTGEADGDYDHEIFDKICSQIKSKTGINCEYKEFDKYQGVYIRAGRMKFWIKEVYYKGKKKNEDKNKPYSNSYLINPDGDKVSSTKGDYFNLKDNYVFEGYTLVLVDNKTGEKKNIENPTKSQLPNLLDVGYTFQYEDGSETMIMIFYEENNVEIEIEVSVKDPNGKKNVNTTGLVEYIKSNKIESAKSQFAKTKDGWVVRVLNKNEDCIECGNWQVKYVDGKNIGKVADINQNELTLIEDNGIKAEDVYEHTTMRIDNIIGKGKIYKDLSKEEIIEAEKKLRLRADRITKSEKMEVFVQILKERGFTKLSKELKERVVGKSIKAEEGEDYISSIKVTYEDGKEQIYKIGDIYGDLGELTVVKRITHNPAEYYIGFSAGAGGAEGYVKVGEDNIIEDFNKGKVKNIIELNGEENGIESSVVQSSMPNKFWIDNVILNISEGNPFREHEFKYEVLHKKYDAIDDIKQIKESLIKDLNKYNKIYPKLNTVKIWDALNMIKSENEGVTPVSQIVESAEAGKNQQTQIKCKVKIILGDNFDTPELVAKEYDNTIIGGDKLDIETLASSFSEGIVEFWPIVKSNVNFSDYKDEQEVIDWFENEIVTVIMDSMESLFGNRPELVEVKDIQFIKKHGIPVSQIVESSEEVPQNVYLDYDKDDTYYGSIMKYDENKDMIYFKNFYNTNETWNMPREEFEEMLESGELKESKVPKK